MATRPDEALAQGGSVETAAVPRREARAYRQARRHSRRVRWLRRTILALAVVAVGGMGAYAVLDPFGRPTAGLSLGPVSVAGSKIVMESPRLTGFRKESRGYEVTASAALQDIRKPGLIELKGMKARLTLDAAGRIGHLEAATGLFDTQKEHLDLASDIRLWTDDGQEARLTSAAIDFKAGNAVSRESVIVTLPNGTVEADGMEIADNGRVISFIGRVRTLVQGSDRQQQGVGPVAAASEPALRTERAAEASLPEPGR